MKKEPYQTLKEEILNSITHGVGALFGIVALVLLLLKSNTNIKMLASVIYGTSMFILMLMSCLYHAFKSNTKVKRLWRRFDYMSIYLLIAGTFAPILLVYYNTSYTIFIFIDVYMFLWYVFMCACVFEARKIIDL